MRVETVFAVVIFSETAFAHDDPPPRDYCALVHECSIGLNETLENEKPEITDFMERERIKYPELYPRKKEQLEISDSGPYVSGDSQWEDSIGFSRNINVDYLVVTGPEHSKFHQAAANVLEHAKAAAIWEIEGQERTIDGLERMIDDFQKVHLPHARDNYNACHKNCDAPRKQLEEVEKSLDSLEKFKTFAIHRRHLLANMICQAKDMIAKNLEIEKRQESITGGVTDSTVSGDSPKSPLELIVDNSSISGIGEVIKPLDKDPKPEDSSSLLSSNQAIAPFDELAALNHVGRVSDVLSTREPAQVGFPKQEEKPEPIYGDQKNDLFARVHKKYQDVERTGALEKGVLD